jgi:hypothetical protein
MWEPRRLTILWAFTACYRDSFILHDYADGLDLCCFNITAFFHTYLINLDINILQMQFAITKLLVLHMLPHRIINPFPLYSLYIQRRVDKVMSVIYTTHQSSWYEPGQLSQYSDWLQVGLPRNRSFIPHRGKRFSLLNGVHAGSKVYQWLCPCG